METGRANAFLPPFADRPGRRKASHGQRERCNLKSETRPLRIVLYEPSGRGGVCHYTHQLAEYLARAGVDVTLITTEDYELEHIERHFKIDYVFGRSLLTQFRQRFATIGRNSPESLEPVRNEETLVKRSTIRGAKSGRNYPPFLRSVRLRLLHLRTVLRFLLRRPDIVHFQWLVNRAADSQFIDLLRRVGIPVIYTAHDIEPHMAVSEEDYAALQRLYKSVVKIIVHAERNKHELVSSFAVDAAKVVVIPHGSYDFLCAPEPLTRDAARKEIGVPSGKKVVLFFGLIKRYKGLEYLVEAFEEVRRRVQDAFLLIVGDIYAADVEGHAFYTDLIKRLRDRADVLCVARYVPLESVGSYLAASDVVVLPYTHTYQSGVLLAAYAAGKPVVVTETGGLSEVVEANRSGLVVPPRDSQSLAEGIVRILSEPGLRDSMGERAKFLARTYYAWDLIAARTTELYESILSGDGESSKGSRSAAGGPTSAVGHTANGKADEVRRVTL